MVHEWGTFTGFSTSEGVHLPFSSAIGADLPMFVYNRAAQAARLKSTGPREPGRRPPPGLGLLLGKSGRPLDAADGDAGDLLLHGCAAGRGRPRRFPERADHGILPAGAGDGAGVSQPNKGDADEDSFLSWGKVRLDPRYAVPRAWRPAAPAGPARVATSPTWRTRPTTPTPARPIRRSSDLTTADSREPAEEKFLFYRGLGNFTLPVTLRPDGDDRFTLHAGSPTRSTRRSSSASRATASASAVTRTCAATARCELPAETRRCRPRRRRREGPRGRGALRAGGPGDGQDVGG